MMLVTEDFKSSAPTRITSISTISPATYSMRPCPSGCSLSPAFAAILKPTSATSDETASEALLKASETTATEAARMPAVNLAANRSTLIKMPVPVAKEAHFSRSIFSYSPFPRTQPNRRKSAEIILLLRRRAGRKRRLPLFWLRALFWRFRLYLRRIS